MQLKLLGHCTVHSLTCFLSSIVILYVTHSSVFFASTAKTSKHSRCQCDCPLHKVYFNRLFGKQDSLHPLSCLCRCERGPDQLAWWVRALSTAHSSWICSHTSSDHRLQFNKHLHNLTMATCALMNFHNCSKSACMEHIIHSEQNVFLVPGSAPRCVLLEKKKESGLQDSRDSLQK